MQPWISLAAIAVLALAALPVQAAELTLTLDSYIGFGAPTGQNPDPNTCLSPNCVLFTGTLTDNDVDLQPDLNPSFLFIGFPYTAAVDGTDFAGILSLDNTAPALGVLSGDTNALDLNPPTSESGAVFGIDIPVGTPNGVYQDTVFLDITPYDYNATDGQYEFGTLFTVSADVTVDVTPEPAAASLMLAGFVGLVVLCGVKRKCTSHDPLR